MATFLVNYDLVGKEEDYTELIAALKKDGAVKVLYSEWLVRNTGSAGDVAKRYLAHLDSNDRLFVCDVNDWGYKRILNQEAAKKLLP